MFESCHCSHCWNSCYSYDCWFLYVQICTPTCIHVLQQLYSGAEVKNSLNNIVRSNYRRGNNPYLVARSCDWLLRAACCVKLRVSCCMPPFTLLYAGRVLHSSYFTLRAACCVLRAAMSSLMRQWPIVANINRMRTVLLIGDLTN